MSTQHFCFTKLFSLNCNIDIYPESKDSKDILLLMILERWADKSLPECSLSRKEYCCVTSSHLTIGLPVKVTIRPILQMLSVDITFYINISFVRRQKLWSSVVKNKAHIYFFWSGLSSHKWFNSCNLYRCNLFFRKVSYSMLQRRPSFVLVRQIEICGTCHCLCQNFSHHFCIAWTVKSFIISYSKLANKHHFKLWTVLCLWHSFVRKSLFSTEKNNLYPLSKIRKIMF